MANGVVVRFDSRRGYGFVGPDDGGEDVFVHQNNINMEGFRYLQVGERVSYELEVGEKGMKAVSVTLLEPRVARPRDQAPDERDGPPQRRGGDDARPYEARAPRGRDDSAGDDGMLVDKLRRKQERLISLLVEKGVLAPGEVDGV